MAQQQSNTKLIVPQTRLSHAADEFIAERLPQWLRQASPAQLNKLRDSFKNHRQSQDALRQATLELIPLQAFASEQLHTLLASRLPPSVQLEALEWLDVTPRFERIPGTVWPIYGPAYKRRPGMLRLMQNFSADADFFSGTGLVEAGGDEVLSGSPAILASSCRTLDAGRRYQALLGRVFSAATCTLLAEDKRAGLKLALEVAALKGQVSVAQKMALDHLADGNLDHAPSSLRGTPAMLEVLGQPVADALVVSLHDDQRQTKGVILYQPSHPTGALRHYPTLADMGQALALEMKQPDLRQFFSQLIGLEGRAAFLDTLDKRLRDDRPDLALALAPVGDAFGQLVARQVERVKQDARLLLVPTADVDERAARQRIRQWTAAGLSLVNLAGLFIPVVGALLLGQLVAQVLAEVFEGAEDWQHGHQHEALEHMLGVAETLAVTAAVAAGANIVARGVMRSAFVDGLEPVEVGGRRRLWSNDLTCYAASPEETSPGEDGLIGKGDERWIRIDETYHQLRRDPEHGPWRIRHPRREGAFGPRLLGNGERGWRLFQARPLEWQDSARMLDSLWPQAVRWTTAQAEQVLAVAGMGVDELRGVLVENRRLPVNLRDTLRRFQARQRIDAFFAGLKARPGSLDDLQIQAWCLGQPGLRIDDGERLRQLLLRREAALREPLFAHLTQVTEADTPLLTLVRRDFPGLPDAYAHEALADTRLVQEDLALAESKLPLEVASKARSLLRLANLSRAVEGLYLPSAYTDDTGRLALALLGQLPRRPEALKLELRQDVGFGAVLASYESAGDNSVTVNLVREQAGFRLYGERLEALKVQPQAPAGILEAILASLSQVQREAMGLEESAPTVTLRQLLLTQLPATVEGRMRLLGWQAHMPWFNPGRRLPDGRVGYLLSGRAEGGAASARVLRQRLRSLYPGLDEPALEVELQRLLQADGAAYRLLAELEDDYAELDRCLNRWVSAELDARRGSVRQRLAERLRRAWRLQADPVPGEDGQRLDLSGLRVTTLPELPPQLSFSRITVLVMSETPVRVVHADFLRGFGALRELNLSRNALLQVPRGIAYLTELRRLRLAHNDIRLDSQALDALNGLPGLAHLDLSYNPLGAYRMRYNQLPHLQVLNLRHCRLGAWPEGIEQCGFLEQADLRDNLLATVPSEVLQMPHAYRRAFLVKGNPLKAVDIGRLYALETIQEHLHLPEARALIDPVHTRALWLPGPEQAALDARARQWDTLQGLPGSSGLFRLLGLLEYSSDFVEARDELGRRVWQLLDAVQDNAELRERTFHLADALPGCENGVADRFAMLQVNMAVDLAERNTLHAPGEQLLALGRGLFRLERLEQVARQDMRERIENRQPFEHLTVSLAYRVGLRQRLGLPGQPHSMLHGPQADVSDAQLEQARRAVLGAETPQALAASLSQRMFWQRYVQTRHPAAFDLLEQIHAPRRAALNGMQDNPLLQALRVEEASDRQELAQQLTEQLLIGLERGQA